MEPVNSKLRLAQAIQKRMETTPLDKITVTDLVRDSGVTRQTFYRNFRDKYDLVNWHFEQLVQKSFRQIGVSLTLREGLQKKFQFIRAEWCFFNQAFRSQDHNSLMAYDYECILKFYTDVITRKTGGPLEPEIAFLLEMYCRGSIHMTVEWVTGGMPLPVDEVVDLLIQALPPRLEGLLSDL
ncbi:MAG: TetR/AcrR family transcriptional regulator C-terminal domain-containing protein [Oscillospiraceae bacterium]|nr:TetR/AcrR family transcriptional regulator C-terminal domain-containing protein [Oscillospiraceae bacterium]